VTLKDKAGATVATETVSARRSYVFVVPPGSYRLSTPSFCFGEALVTAGRVSRADTVCSIP